MKNEEKPGNETVLKQILKKAANQEICRLHLSICQCEKGPVWPKAWKPMKSTSFRRSWREAAYPAISMKKKQRIIRKYR